MSVGREARTPHNAGAALAGVAVRLSARLRARLSEVDGVFLALIHGDEGLTQSPNPEHGEDMRVSMRIAFEHCLLGIERGEDNLPPVPALLLSQARVAARSGITLDTLLRRYFAGHTVLSGFLVEEAERDGSLGTARLQLLMQILARIFDRLVATVSEEYAQESGSPSGTTDERRAKNIEGLLDGDTPDTSCFDYDFDAHHVGMVTKGHHTAEAVHDLAKALDRRLLRVSSDEGVHWAWLGGRRPLDVANLEHLVSDVWPPQFPLAIGEPAQGLSGWRLTHRQAKAALRIAVRSSSTLVRYADVALLASMLQDELFATSMRELYLVPLEQERDSGEALRQTLRAYFGADRNVSSAASALGVSRRTVANRLKVIESLFDKPLREVGVEVEAALRLHDLESIVLR